MLFVKDIPRTSHPHLPQRHMVKIQSVLGPDNKHERRRLAYSAAATLEHNHYQAVVHNYAHHTTLAVHIDARGPDHAYQALTYAWFTHLQNFPEEEKELEPPPCA